MNRQKAALVESSTKFKYPREDKKASVFHNLEKNCDITCSQILVLQKACQWDWSL